MKMKIPVQFLHAGATQTDKCRVCQGRYEHTPTARPGVLGLCWACSQAAMAEVEQVSPGRYRVKQPRDFSKPFGGSRR